jgi:hypothetical protein
VADSSLCSEKLEWDGECHDILLGHGVEVEALWSARCGDERCGVEHADNRLSWIRQLMGLSVAFGQRTEDLFTCFVV